jgi:glycerol kinase
MLFNIHTQEWDAELLRLLDIPQAMLPKVIDSAGFVGTLDPAILGKPVPVMALAGDQHASLFGQACFGRGEVKNTYGTGCFMLMNTGNTPAQSANGLLTTIAWRLNGKPVYALEGSVFMGGATIQWLRDELKLIGSAAETEALALSVGSSGGVYLVPAHTGLGAPWWDMYSRGALLGMTRGTNRAHIVRAALEAIAYQSADLMDTMIHESGVTPDTLNVDGGASVNGFLMQFQADMLNLPAARPRTLETTALGAALLAGLAAGCYGSLDEITAIRQTDAVFTPRMPIEEARTLMHGWRRAVERSLGWIEKA